MFHIIPCCAVDAAACWQPLFRPGTISLAPLFPFLFPLLSCPFVMAVPCFLVCIAIWRQHSTGNIPAFFPLFPCLYVGCPARIHRTYSDRGRTRQHSIGNLRRRPRTMWGFAPPVLLPHCCPFPCLYHAHLFGVLAGACHVFPVLSGQNFRLIDYSFRAFPPLFSGCPSSTGDPTAPAFFPLFPHFSRAGRPLFYSRRRAEYSTIRGLFSGSFPDCSRFWA